MFVSSDGLWNIAVLEDASKAVLPPSDFSIFATPSATDEMASLVSALENMPVTSHVSLVIPRAMKGDIRDSFSMISSTLRLGLLAVVSITYDKPSRYSTVVMSPISETGFLLYKGNKPDISNTGWFQGESAKEKGENATTHWDLTRYVTGKFAIEPAQQTTLGKFAWDMGLLLASLSEAPRYNRFVYGMDPSDENLAAFVKAFGIECQVFAGSAEQAMKLLSLYEKVKNPAEEYKK